MFDADARCLTEYVCMCGGRERRGADGGGGGVGREVLAESHLHLGQKQLRGSIIAQI